MWKIGGAGLLALLVMGCGTTVYHCVPTCDGKSCGSDGCGGTCGTCDQGYICGADGTCSAGCTPDCSSKECGDDGCGGSCGTCQSGFTCLNTGACELDSAHSWTLTITSGMVQQDDPNGDAWDVPGGLPDPQVCLTISGMQKCTSVAQDTLTPTWNQSLGSYPAAALQNITVSFVDSDLTANDPICATTVLAIGDQNFQNGTWSVGCTSGSFSATLTP